MRWTIVDFKLLTWFSTSREPGIRVDTYGLYDDKESNFVVESKELQHLWCLVLMGDWLVAFRLIVFLRDPVSRTGWSSSTEPSCGRSNKQIGEEIIELFFNSVNPLSNVGFSERSPKRILVSWFVGRPAIASKANMYLLWEAVSTTPDHCCHMRLLVLKGLVQGGSVRCVLENIQRLSP
jgi:hypothetical protein